MKETRLTGQRGFRMWKSGKQWLTSGAVAGVAVISLAGGAVSADEVDAPVPTESAVVAEAPVVETPAPVSGVEVTESTIVNDTPTGIASTNLTQAAQGNNGEAFDASENKVTGETPVSIDHSELTNAAKDAEQKGVDVKQDPTSVAPTASNAAEAESSKQSIVAAEHAKAEELKSTANSYSTAVSQWTDTKNSVVAFNTELDKAHLSAVDSYNSFVATLNEDTKAVVAEYKDAIIKETQQIQQSADGKSVAGYQAYIKALAEQQELNKASIQKYMAEKAHYNSQSTSRDSVIAKNHSMSTSVTEANEKASTSVAEENNRNSNSAKAVNDGINAENKAIMEEVGLSWTGNYSVDKAEVDKFNSESGAGAGSNQFSGGHDRTAALPADANGYTPSGSSTMLNAVDLGNGITAIAKGNLTQGGATVYLKGKVDKSKVVTDITWANQALEGEGLRTFTPGDGNDIWGNVYNYAVGGANRFYIVKGTKWYKIAGAATTLDGKKHDLYVSFHKDPQGLAPEYVTDEIAVWNANQAINSLDGAAYAPGAADGIRATFSLDRPDNQDPNILWVELISDIDGGQYLQDFTGKLLGVGGGMATDSVTSGKIASNEDLGFTYGKGMNSNALDGYNSSPDGTVLAIGNGVFSYVLRNTAGGNGSAVARADFGGKSRANIEIPVDPIDIKAPVSFTPKEFTPTPFNPENVPEIPAEPELEVIKLTAPADPIFNKIPEEPKKPTVNYHLTTLNSNTPVQKHVSNEDGVDINNQSVAKGSTNVFTFNPSPLVAGRPITTSLVNSDYIQDGLELDIAAMQRENKNWEIDYDTTTRLLKVTATSTELALANADRSVAYDPTSIKVVFSVQNDGATYTNTFRQDVNGGATGNVIVEYYVEGTGEKLGSAVDTEEAPVGESYDTTDLKSKIIAKNGKVYELVPSHVEGDGETGEVTDGDKVVKYFYKEVPPVPNTGSVIVHYEDEEGNTISTDEVDESNKPVNDPYSTKDRIKVIEGYELVPVKTKGNEDGKITEGVTEVTYVYKRLTPKPTPGDGYTSYSNKVTIHTPGSPDNPNNPNNPNGSGNHKIQPLKNNTNEKGDNINNKTLLQNDVNYYVAEWDLDQYINDKSSKSAIAKGFASIDNPDDKALEGIVKDFKAVTSKGEAVEGLSFYEAHSDKLSELPQSVQALISNSGIDVSDFGTFYVWVADDSQAFYDKYVQTGTDIFFNLPMRVKEGFVGDYTNQTWQIDFGNGYTGNVVQNDVPDLTPKKDVIVDGQSVDGQVIAYGQEFKYLLKGAVLPGNRGDIIWEYKYIDDYDQTGDKFLETYGVKATTDITVKREITLEEDAVYGQDVTLADGKVIKAGETIPKGTKLTITEVIEKGSDLTQFTTMEHDVENGIVTIAFKEDFLKSIVSESEFGADATLDFKRIAYGEFENTYINRINGVDYISNTVKTSTPAPVVPEQPAPEPLVPAPNTPVEPAAVLPKTGTTESSVGLVGGMLAVLASVGLFFSGKRKED